MFMNVINFCSSEIITYSNIIVCFRLVWFFRGLTFLSVVRFSCLSFRPSVFFDDWRMRISSVQLIATGTAEVDDDFSRHLKQFNSRQNNRTNNRLSNHPINRMKGSIRFLMECLIGKVQQEMTGGLHWAT